MSFERNRAWADTFIKKVDPGFRHRWEIYDSILKRLTGKGAFWLDAGCGQNTAIEEFPSTLTVGIDRYRPSGVRNKPPTYFVIGSLEHLPFRNASFTLVTMNAVVEHLEHPAQVFSEVRRVLAPSGNLLVHTTNSHSPLVLFGRFLPEFIRHFLFSAVFGAKRSDVFPAYHRANTREILGSIDGFEVEEIHLVQDINRSNRFIFFCLFAYYCITRLPGLWRLRTNLIFLLRKKG